MTYIVKEGTISLIAIGYYLIHRKKVENKNCLARVLLTRERKKGDSIASNIISTIDFILTSNVKITRDGKDEDVNATCEVQKGDYIHYSMVMFHEYWKYDGQKLNYDEQMSC